MENTIELYVWTKGEVIAHFSGPHAAEVTRLFGTADLPLPYVFDSCLDAAGIAERRATVLARVQALNPDVDVRWRETKRPVAGPHQPEGRFTVYQLTSGRQQGWYMVCDAEGNEMVRTLASDYANMKCIQLNREGA